MEKLLTEFLSSVSSIAATMVAQKASLDQNNALLERVVAGQEAAIAKLEGTAAPARRTRASAKAAETAPETETTPAPAAKAEPATPPPHVLLASPNSATAKVANPKTGVDEDTPTAAFRASDFGREQVKSEFIGWLGETSDPDQRKQRTTFAQAIGQHFGVKLPFHPTDGLPDDESRKQALFFLRRKREGADVNFSADYDFDADPLTGQSAAAAEEDELDALG